MVTFLALSRISAVYLLIGLLIGLLLLLGSISFFRPPILKPLYAVHRSIILESLYGIYDSIVGLFAPVLRLIESYEEDCLVKAAPC
jgi:hypothetical protein